MPIRRLLLLICLLSIPPASPLQGDALEELAEKAPLLAKALKSDGEIRILLRQKVGQEALSRILALASSSDADVRKAMDIICRPVPRAPKPRTILVDGEPGDWAGVMGARIREPSLLVREHHAALSFVAAYADRKMLYLAARTQRGDFLSTGGNDIGFDIDLIDHPALDWRITVKGETLATTQQAHPVQESPRHAISRQVTVRCGDALEVAIPISLLSDGKDVKPVISVRAFASIEGKRGIRHRSDYAFVTFPGAKPEHYCLPYARSLFTLCLDCDVGKDDLTALALAISRAVYWVVGDDEVRRQARKDTAEVYRISREIVAWQRERGMKLTLDDYPLEARLTWAMQGAERVGVRYFPIFRPGKRPTLEEYRWISLRPENLRRLRKMAEENELVDPDISATAEKIDKWARSVQHYRVKLEEMKRRCDRGILKKETYEEAVGEAKQGIDKWLKLGGKDVFYGTMNSANAVLKLYDKTGNFYGNCSDHTLLCSAMYSALGIAPLRLFREPSRQKAVNHVWPGYYDPLARRWKSPQKGKTRSHSCVYFKLGWYPVYFDSYCLPMARLRANDPAELHRNGVGEFTRQHLAAMLTRGFDEAYVREHILTPRRRTVLPKVTMPDIALVKSGKSAIRVGVFADEKVGQRSVRKTIEVLSSASDIDVTWFLASDVSEKLCRDLDVFIFPGGSSRQAEIVGKGGCEMIKRAVQKGKGYVGLCAGGYMAAISWNWCEPIRMVAARTDTKYWDRGAGAVELEVAGVRDPLWLSYINGPVFSPVVFGGLGKPVALANYVSEFRKNKAPEGTMRGQGAIIASEFGRGRVALFGPHPELTPGMEHLLVDAVRWAGGKGKREKKITWETVLGRDAADRREIRPRIRVERGSEKQWKGIAVGAPRATPDWHTGDVALALTKRHGLPSVCAYGMQSMFIGHAFDVSWPSERTYTYWRRSEQRTYTADARRVYDAYQTALLDVGEREESALDLYVELRGHSLKVEPKEGAKSKKPIYRQVIEACAVGFSENEVRKLKKVYGQLAEKMAPKVKAPIYFRNLPEDREYEVGGHKVEFEYSTIDIQETGAMRPACARRSLLLALPRVARFEGAERRKVVDILGGLLAEAGKMARDGLARPPGKQDILLVTDLAEGDPMRKSIHALCPGRIASVHPSEFAPSRTMGKEFVLVALRRGVKSSGLKYTTLKDFARRGGTVVMDLGNYGEAAGLKVKRSAVAEKPLRIEVESDVTKGFHAGDRVPWFGGEFEQGMDLRTSKSRKCLAASDAGAKLIEEQVGKGRIIAMDLLGVGEPVLGRHGTYNKYVFLSNVLGRGVKWGEFVPKKLSYADFVGAMRKLAETYQGVTLKDEGPASGGHRIYSLNLGDPAKPMFFIYAVTHGTEWEPAYGLLSLVRRIAASPSACGLDLDRYAFKFTPILNPSGYEKRTRKNANGVDINRNSSYFWETYSSKEYGKGATKYDSTSGKWKGTGPFSEFESQTYKKIVDTNNIHCLIDFHCMAHFLSVPTTAREDNDAKVASLRRIFARDFAGRYVAGVPEVPGVGQYRLGRMIRAGESPFLLQYGAKDRYGVLIELPGCTSGTYGTVMQTDIAATACMAAIEAYGGLRRE